MDISQASDTVRATLFLAFWVAAPMLLIGLLVGVVISLLQAVTQIQEQTLTFVPKVAAMILTAVVVMPYVCQRLVEYTREMFTAMP